MATHQTLRELILCEVQKTPECEMDMLVDRCSQYPWHEVFLEVNRLSQAGELRLKKFRRYSFALALPSDESPKATR